MSENKVYKDITIVNENDEVIGAKNLLVAIDQQLLRRTVRIFVCNKSNQILLQKRSQFVHKPGLLDMSAGGHVDLDESYIEAAQREVTEELGLNDFTLVQICTSWKNGESFSSIYKILVEEKTIFTTHPQEVEYVQWLTKEEINTKVSNNPEMFSPDFISTWKAWTKHL
jgi:isopentenyldiphosphate isomerase